ncbi:Hypothetical predicted protein [Scomber scombrus]|uniref:Uncharacterized protein n=1 Tax=Scomber scombrus TaxID=13677 RepID=A0AAV1PDN9_SCOSC
MLSSWLCEAYGPVACEEGKNVLFPGKTVASKICVPATSSFEAPRPSTYGYPEQRAFYMQPENWETVQEGPNPPSPNQWEKKILIATSETTANSRYSTPLHKQSPRCPLYTSKNRQRGQSDADLPEVQQTVLSEPAEALNETVT